MPIEEERLARLKQQRSQEAIGLAMKGRWQEAVEVNKSIIELFPEDVDAYNRMGRAYMELGEYAKSRESYRRAVELDPYNAIARKNLRRLRHLKDVTSAVVDSEMVEPHHFIEEIGKAGVVNVYELGAKEVLARTVAGDKLRLKIDGPNLVAENSWGEYLGKVEPRYATRLIRLMAGGNRYNAAVVSVSEEAISIIIREVYQDPSQAGRLSFPPKGLEEVHPYVSDRILKVDEYEEEEESGYTIVGGEEVEVLPEETGESENDFESEED